MDRAYALLNFKGITETASEWVVEGIASTPSADRMGDEVDPMGAQFKTPMPLLWQHDSQKPVGRVEFAKPTSKGIPFRAHLPKVAEAGVLKERIDEAVQSIKYRLVAAVSIGFRALKDGVEVLKTGGLKFTAWEWLELSLVTIPANAEATITSIKSLDRDLLASSGRRGTEGLRNPGASGTTGQPATSTTRSPKGTAMKTLAQLLEQKQTTTARMTEISALITEQKASDEDVAEFDTLATEEKNLDLEIRVASFHERQAGNARPVDGTPGAPRAARNNPVQRNTDPDDKFAGQSFARLVKVKATAFIMGESQVTIAEKMFGKTHPNLVRYVKAAVAGGGTGSGEWGAELVGIDNRYTGDFVTYLNGVTGFDKLGLREAPRNVSVKGMDAPAIGYWTGESKAIKASAPSASSADLTSLKIAGKCVMSNELAMDSSPGAEGVVRDALAEALALTLDQTFFSATAASAGVSPAGIVNGLAQIAMGSQDAAGLRAFVNAAAAGFISAKTASGLVFAMSPGTALATGMLVNALGQSEFPGLTENGGTLLGRRVVVSDNVDPSQIYLINPREIWRIGDDGVDFAVSREAMVEQDSAPQGASDTPVASSATLVSMFDTDSVCIRATRRVSYKFRRTQAAAVAWTDTADFGGVAS
jgi:HK97 family phage prohead protease